uniref:Uncharacterized protein n=1 Tax=Rhipicephalus zambeziensis TaxID=60191 RepID=A0A224YT42_9ACAR
MQMLAKYKVVAVEQWLWCSAADPNAAAVAFRWRRNGRGPCTVRCQCTLKNTRWSKFPEPSTTACLIILWFWHVKPQKLIIIIIIIANDDPCLNRRD